MSVINAFYNGENFINFVSIKIQRKKKEENKVYFPVVSQSHYCCLYDGLPYLLILAKSYTNLRSVSRNTMNVELREDITLLKKILKHSSSLNSFVLQYQIYDSLEDKMLRLEFRL